MIKYCTDNIYLNYTLCITLWCVMSPCVTVVTVIFEKPHWVIFVLKKFHREKFSPIFFGAARWPDSMRVCIRDKYALAQIFALLFAYILIIMFQFEVVLLSCVFFWFFDKAIAKLVVLLLCFPKLLYFVACCSCVVRNFLWVSMHHAVIFVVLYSIPLLPYFLKCFGALFVCFWGAKPSLLYDLFGVGFPPYQFLVCVISPVVFCFLVCSGLV